MTKTQLILKRSFDFVLSLIGLIALSPIILLGFVLASLDTRSSGFFVQVRVGKDGRHFNLYKIKTMRANENISTSITVRSDKRITKLGAFFRRTKIDELPQLWNVVKGDMSLVGPRPDVPGYADKLSGKERLLLSVRPGITGPASLAFRNEEEILAKVANPIEYNDNVIYPEKVRINLEYINSWSLRNDLKYIFKTVLG